MSDTIATYSFLPWLREGIANNITAADHDESVKLRTAIPVKLTISGTGKDGEPLPDDFVCKTVSLYGPGDIIGIDAGAIVKTEPRNWITNFEANYLPYIEFYKEDFLWRYSPTRPNGERLRPWLTLVVLKEDEFDEGKNGKGKPLPFFILKTGFTTTQLFPKASELWAWAHVHVNKDLSDPPNGTSAEVVNTRLSNLLRQDPDQGYSRLLSPRKLISNTGYHAFLIPSFESGRLAGLGSDIPEDLAATRSAWASAATMDFPYYHRWYFRTGDTGDFEFLVNLLKPTPADKRVGVRDIDVLHPGSNLPKISNPDLQGVLKLGGALRVPFDTQTEEDQTEIRKYDEWDEHPYPHPFSLAISKLINLGDDYTETSKTVEEINKDAGIVSESNPDKGDPDPVITSPLYGRWHALQQRLLKDKINDPLPHTKNWVHELNLDPRFRVAAGLGTKVLQQGQEDYMQAAWEQVGNVVEANNKIRWAQLATNISRRWHTRYITTLNTAKAYEITAPMQKRILGLNKSMTVRKEVQASLIPAVLASAPFRAIVRQRGNMMKKIVPPGDPTSPVMNTLLERVNSKELVIVPPKIDPPGAVNLIDVARDNEPSGIPPGIRKLLEKYRWFKYFPFALLALLAIFLLMLLPLAVAIGMTLGAAVIAILAYRKLDAWSQLIKQHKAVLPENQVPEVVDSFPSSANFVLSQPGSGFVPLKASTDSSEARNFKRALKDVFAIMSTPFPDPVRSSLSFREVTDHVVAAINPAITIPKRTWGSVKIPGRISVDLPETFAPIMVYPEIDIPMYQPLSALSSELFLPNINLIEPNSITLLENNQKFIESYMVGVNHEMSRELLWREYPTDQRGSYFRQFWDVSSFLPPQPVPVDIKEKLRDIPKIHEWSRININHTDPEDLSSPLKNELGQHNLRALQSGKTQLVLVIRGELLKKYPTAVVYAHRADWGLNSNDERDVNVERRFVTLTDEEKNNPPLSKQKTPLFEAKVDPDIYFFGFDLDDEEARGKLEPDSVDDNAGWFFVIKERPGEPRYGLDINQTKLDDGTPIFLNWNQLSWEHLNTTDGACIELNQTVRVNPTDSDGIDEYLPNADDEQAQWDPDTNAAELAYILYQVPVLVGVHASRMLPK